MILVDSTVWIDLLRANRTAPATVLERLLELGEVATAPVIVQEILQGARNAAGFLRLRARLLALPMLDPRPGAASHAAAAYLYARCRWAGITPRSPHDCLIAAIAIEHGIALLHDDRDFEALATIEPRLHLVTCLPAQ